LDQFRINFKYFQAEEAAEVKQQIIDEKKEAVQELEVSNSENCSNEDIVMERMR